MYLPGFERLKDEPGLTGAKAGVDEGLAGILVGTEPRVRLLKKMEGNLLAENPAIRVRNGVANWRLSESYPKVITETQLQMGSE